MAELDDVYKRLNENSLDIAVIKTWREGVDEKLNTFVTRIEFNLVKIIVYGIAGTALLSVLTALISKVVVKS